MKIKSNFKKILALLLLLVTVVSMFTGCGFAGSYTDLEKDYATGSSSNNKNKLCAIYEDGCYIDSAKLHVLGTKNIKASDIVSKKYGDSFTSNFTFIFRDAAWVMTTSLFGTSRSGGDLKFMDLGKLSLHPKDVLNKALTSTKGLLTTGQGKLGNILSLIKACAAAVLISIWAMGFVSQIINEKFTMETALKGFMQFLCGALLILNGSKVIEAFATAGIEMTKVNLQNISGFGAFSSQISGYLNGAHVFTVSLAIKVLKLFGVGVTAYIDYGSLIVILFLALPFFAQIQCAIKIVSQTIMLMLELVIRITFAPVVFAFGAQSGFTQDATRFMRSTLACAVQPVVIMVGIALINEIANAVAQIFGGAAGSLTGVPAILCVWGTYIVLNTFVGETKQISRSVIA